MAYQHSKRYCSNGHCVEDDQLNYCPECGMPLSSELPEQQNQQRSDNQNTKPSNSAQNERFKQKKKTVGYVVLSAIIVVLVFVILELTDTTYFIPSMHRTIQTAYRVDIHEKVEEVRDAVEEKAEDAREAVEAAVEDVGEAIEVVDEEVREAVEEVAEADLVTGKCGKNLTWSYTNGRLEIIGMGAMYDYRVSDRNTPWREYADEIETVILPDGITKIGDNAFYGCSALKNIELPDSVKEIGICAFECCDSLFEISIPAGVTALGDWAFTNCMYLTIVDLSYGLVTIGENCFLNCPKLRFINIPDSVRLIGSNAFVQCDKLEGLGVSNNEYAKRYAEDNGLFVITIEEVTEAPREAVEAASEDAWMPAVEITAAEYDALNSIVPGFGISSTQIKEKMNLVFNAADLWVETNNFPYQNMSEFPLLPNMDIVSKDYLEYFGSGTDEAHYIYYLDSDFFEKIDESDTLYLNDDTNAIIYGLRISSFVPDKLICNSISIFSADGYKMSYVLQSASFDPRHELVGAGLAITIIKDDSWLLEAEFEYYNHIYPDCPINYIDQEKL